MSFDENLRGRMARELDTLGGVDVADAAQAAGKRKVRRRRAGAGVAALATAGLVAGGVLVVTGGDQGGQDTQVASSTTGTRSGEASDPKAADPREEARKLIEAAAADGTVTYDEWEATNVASFDVLLPDRFGNVEVVPQPKGTPEPRRTVNLRTSQGNPRVNVGMGIQGFKGKPSMQPGAGDCAEARESEAQDPTEWEIIDCADGDIDGKIDYRAHRASVVLDESSDTPGEVSRWGEVAMIGDNFWLMLTFGGPTESQQVDLTAEEMEQIATDSLFLDLAELGTTYFAERPGDHKATPSTDPVWPL